MNETILVVEDDKELTELLELYLSAEGYQVTTCLTGAEAQAALDRMEPDLAILDVMLPDDDGFALCRHLRERSFCPVMFLTARTAETTRFWDWASAQMTT